MRICIAALLLLSCSFAFARPKDVEIRDGKLFVNGQWLFLKTAKPLRNFADEKEVDQLIRDLDILKQKHFNCLELNCYWYHFDHTGTGAIDVSTAPLTKLINAIADHGMYPCLSVEIYSVGGGTLPREFWKLHPNAGAVDSTGATIRDTEYGTNNAVPSQFSPEYLRASRAFMHNIAASVPFDKLLYFETNVEPQYIGQHSLDYSDNARKAYGSWLSTNHLPGPAFPNHLPAPQTFIDDPTWNRFRAEALADWVNQDAAEYQRIAGKDAYIAVDYLETAGPDMRNRNGDSRTFLRHLTCAKIIQVNWHWSLSQNRPNQLAYDNVRAVMKETGRDWAIAEHMTLNGSDYPANIVPAMLRNTIANSTHFSWEFVDVSPKNSPFNCYGDNWMPKPHMAVVDDHWDQWMTELRAAEASHP
jgi:hypothetical protein